MTYQCWPEPAAEPDADNPTTPARIAELREKYPRIDRDDVKHGLYR